MIRDVDSLQFRGSVEQNQGLVIVDFYATWCRPCKMLTPIFDTVSKQFSGEAQFLRVDIDKSLDLARRFNVASVPTIMIFKDGKPIKSIVGFIPKEKFIKIIRENI